MEHDDERRLSALVGDYAEAIREVAALLPTAYERQWNPARVQTRVGTPPLYSDPTGETATDPRRLRVRAAVIESEREIEEATATVRATTARLRHALDAWVGDA